MAKQSGKNASRLYVPEPPFRPGDTPDYSHIAVPVAHTPVRPDPLCPAHETTEHATRLIRVLRFSGEAKGDWAPEIPAETLRGALRDIALTRAMDERMFNMQRQGKMSFYMKSTGEEGVSVGHALALQDTDMIFPTYRQQGILIHRGASMKEMMCQCLSNSGDPLDGKSIPVLYSFKKHGFFSISGNLGTQLIQGVGWAMASAYKNSDEIASVFTGLRAGRVMALRLCAWMEMMFLLSMPRRNGRQSARGTAAARHSLSISHIVNPVIRPRMIQLNTVLRVSLMFGLLAIHWTGSKRISYISVNGMRCAIRLC